MQEKRAAACDAVRYWARHKAGRDEERAASLARELTRLDPAFKVLLGKERNVSNLLALYVESSASRKGTVGAETILARLIFQYCGAKGALGLKVRSGAIPEEEVDRIRKMLTNAIREVHGIAKNKA
jgi:hypothetical protein